VIARQAQSAEDQVTSCAEYNKTLGGLPGLLTALQQRAEHLLELAKSTLAHVQVASALLEGQAV
jgi:23S rRNA pseudoU1915 N3-methylase RlmH